ncbi:hypothetical protein [Actinomadura hibisca]|uniref:hypothetical protein n=1 Tax=Actinomadura hibisca TaxID=68565 RepID=UPI00082AF9A1|nr:hypothetical protein [Actinomadura hibisca]
MDVDRWRPSAGFFRRVNQVVRPLLESPLHPLLSHWLMLVSYTGARTGREYVFPVGFQFWEPREVWAFGARTGWMSGLRDGRPVTLVIRGRRFEATPVIVEERGEVADLLQELVRRKGPRAVKDPFLGLPPDREPTRAEALAAAGRARIARLSV